MNMTCHHSRDYFVLTDAGKPVFTRYISTYAPQTALKQTGIDHYIYTSQREDGDSDTLSSTMGLVQALVSVFIDDNDKLRSINSGELRITFLLRSPLYYVCASTWGEPESVVSCLMYTFVGCNLFRTRSGRIWSICICKSSVSSRPLNLDAYSSVAQTLI